MDVELTKIKDLLIVDTNTLQDERGSFARLFCLNSFSLPLKDKRITQINSSITKKTGTIRGLHFQNSPALETKFVRCIKGKVFDVVVDLRASSETFLQWIGFELSEENRKMLVIPEGCAHGFQTLENDSEMLYFHTEFYSPEHEGGILFDDPAVGIDWPLTCSHISNRDLNLKRIDKDYKGILL